MDGILSGCLVTPSSPADMNVHVAAGSALFSGASVSVAGGQLAVSAADAINPRIDLVFVDSDGTIEIAQGTPAVNPVVPSPDAGTDQEIALIYVPAGATTIPANLIGDRRHFVGSMTSFNGRTGVVSLTKADVTGTGVALADIGLTPTAAPAALGDTTGATAGAAVIAVRSDTLAHAAADAATNAASVAAEINALRTALRSAGLLT